MKLLIEENLPESKVIITEATQNTPKKYYIEGVMMQADVKNGNGRIYESKIMDGALKKYQKLVNENKALGEMGHPLSRPTIDFERVSHVVEKLGWDGTNVVGRAKILESLPMGAIAKGLIENNIPIGISSRGMGSLVERNGINYVQDDFTIAALDLVTQPSAPSAWMNGIMESAEWVYNASENSWQLAEQFKTKYNKLKQKQIDEMQLTDFQNFLRNIR